MKLQLNNIGKIDEATIDIDSITVIAGKNDTGKSTIAKAFYTVFNSFSKYDEQIKFERKRNLANIVLRSYYGTSLNDVLDKILSFYNENPSFDIFASKTRKLMNEYKEIDEESIADEDIEQMYKSFSISDEEILKRIISRRVVSEFDHQVTSFYNAGSSSILLKIHDNDYELKFDNNRIVEFKVYEKLYKKAIYIDDPFILDETNDKYSVRFWGRENNYSHRKDVISSLKKVNKSSAIDEIKIDEHFKRIEELLNEIEIGTLSYDKNITYNKNSIEKNIDLANVSAGLKTFIIIKTLIYNQTIDTKGTLILDEPEIHLHPEWQLLFAKLIVLLHKEFNLHILITTHSPYFLEALEVYSKKYKVHTCYYLLEKTDTNKTMLKNVTQNIDEIYSQMAKPFIELQEISNES